MESKDLKVGDRFLGYVRKGLTVEFSGHPLCEYTVLEISPSGRIKLYGASLFVAGGRDEFWVKGGEVKVEEMLLKSTAEKAAERALERWLKIVPLA